MIATTVLAGYPNVGGSRLAAVEATMNAPELAQIVAKTVMQAERRRSKRHRPRVKKTAAI
ncbi:hypothetical protein [Pseudoxanthomonas winnipegensis]|uniref:hypothetical protein n=1 Tax=Pseudoxanthomonas winnipegensis TaxID=2480810 RepID=UPI0010DF62D3|nr:hypothetical protein [Pseudoxanthomonas winnipegensis]TBV78508.1 hypothetical protein EYC46_01000 [Pseudoxanthomonas winnipegensis]